MKKKVIRDKDGVKYNTPDRTCKDCKHYPCIIGQENCFADFAKYGCTLYDGLCSKS